MRDHGAQGRIRPQVIGACPQMRHENGRDAHQCPVARGSRPAQVPRQVLQAQVAGELGHGRADAKDLLAAEPLGEVTGIQSAILEQLLQRPEGELRVVGRQADGPSLRVDIGPDSPGSLQSAAACPPVSCPRRCCPANRRPPIPPASLPPCRTRMSAGMGRGMTVKERTATHVDDSLGEKPLAAVERFAAASRVPEGAGRIAGGSSVISLHRPRGPAGAVGRYLAAGRQPAALASTSLQNQRSPLSGLITVRS